MGFSVSASTAIIFAGLFLAFGILFPAVSNGYEQIRDAQVERDDAQLDLRNTQIEIDPDQTNSDQLIVNNTGTTTLTVSEVDLLIDGEYQDRESLTTTVDGDDETDLWLPGQSLNITDFDEGDRAKVVTEHGISVFTEGI